jgi:hypothetical protein
MIVENMLQNGYMAFFEVIVTASRVQTKSATKPAFYSLGIHFGTHTALCQKAMCLQIRSNLSISECGSNESSPDSVWIFYFESLDSSVDRTS